MSPRVLAPTVNDLKVWDRLVTRAEKAARRPTINPQSLRSAAERCRKARMPIGHQGKGSVFVQLMAFATTWALLSGTDIVGGRIDRAGELGDLARRCRAILDPSDLSATRPYRADIDG